MSSTWIESLKAYHTEKGSKFSIPRKDSTEYPEILKYHSSRKASTHKPVLPVHDGVSPEAPAPVVKLKRTYKKRVPKPIETVVADS